MTTFKTHNQMRAGALVLTDWGFLMSGYPLYYLLVVSLLIGWFSMTTFKSHLQLRKELISKTTLANNGQVICESQEDLERLNSRLAHSKKNTLTNAAFKRR